MLININGQQFNIVEYIKQLAEHEKDLVVTIYIDCSVARCLISGHDDVALFEWRRQWRWIDTKKTIISSNP